MSHIYDFGWIPNSEWGVMQVYGAQLPLVLYSRHHGLVLPLIKGVDRIGLVTRVGTSWDI